MTDRAVMRWDDLVITLAYFSIPLQIVVALIQYPRLRSMPWHLLLLTVLFALFIFLCGTGHLFRCMGMNSGFTFDLLNFATAAISLLTALYLLPLVPFLFEALDRTLASEIEAKKKVLTFMSFLCHEIRNPLFAISSTVTFMGDDETLVGQQREFLECIDQSTNLMLRLVNDVLDISKLESGKLELEKETFDLTKMLSGAASSIRTDIQQNRGDEVRFEYEVASEVPCHVSGDSVRILQMVFNLLSNSAKFTEKGFVKFSVDTVPINQALKAGWIKEPNTHSNTKKRWEMDVSGVTDQCSDSLPPHNDDFVMSLLCAEEGDPDAKMSENDDFVLKLQVADSGVGISPERQVYLFQPYSQSKLSDYRKHGGTGLGLSIVAKLAEIMGGSIHLDSELGRGSTFTIYVPMKAKHVEPLEEDVKDEKENEEGDTDNNASADFLTLSNRRDGLNESYSIEMMGVSASSFCTPDSTYVLPLTSPISSPRTCSLNFSGELSGGAESADSRTNSKRKSLQSLQRVEEPLSPAPSTPYSNKKHSQFHFEENEKIVLVVDDNAVNLKLLGRMLKHFNLQFFKAENGQEAVDFMKKSRNYTENPQAPHVGLIIMDYNMPVMDGLEATKCIRSMDLDLPIVALTACALEKGLDKFTGAGANEIATKPILRDALHAICKRYLVDWEPLITAN